jgi:hypothetical protein
VKSEKGFPQFAFCLLPFAFCLLPFAFCLKEKYLTRIKAKLLATLMYSPYIPARKITLQKLIE